jgi:hypothetical protein
MIKNGKGKGHSRRSRCRDRSHSDKAAKLPPFSTFKSLDASFRLHSVLVLPDGHSGGNEATGSGKDNGSKHHGGVTEVQEAIRQGNVVVYPENATRGPPGH